MAFKNYLSALDDLPDVLCIQESHLTPKYQPSIPHYQVIRKGRPLSKGIAVHGFSIFNIYNPLSNLLTSTSLDFLSNFAKVILCGDFNAHNGMWGSEYTQ